MSLGDQYNNNKNNYNPTVYSEYKMSNIESKVDSTSLSLSFWNNMLKISIAPRKETSDGSIAFDHENNISIYLSHTKARIFNNEISEFLKDPQACNCRGVDSGAGLITISNGKEFGVNGFFLVIRKINPDTGKPDCSYGYHFKDEYHYAIRNYDCGGDDISFDKQFYKNLEVEQLQSVFKSYYEAMTGAAAYSVINNMKYDMSRLNTKIETVQEKLGIEKFSGKNNKPSTSVFKNNNSKFSASTIDDIEKQIG